MICCIFNEIDVCFCLSYDHEFEVLHSDEERRSKQGTKERLGGERQGRKGMQRHRRDDATVDGAKGKPSWLLRDEARKVCPASRQQSELIIEKQLKQCTCCYYASKLTTTFYCLLHLHSFPNLRA